MKTLATPTIAEVLLEPLLAQRWRSRTSTLPVCKDGREVASRLFQEATYATLALAATALTATDVGSIVEIAGAVFVREE